MAAGHRTLLFSQSRVMLDVIAAALAARGVPFLRIDGAVASAADRQVRCPARTPPCAPCLYARGAGARAAAASGQLHAAPIDRRAARVRRTVAAKDGAAVAGA